MNEVQITVPEWVKNNQFKRGKRERSHCEEESSNISITVSSFEFVNFSYIKISCELLVKWFIIKSLGLRTQTKKYISA